MDQNRLVVVITRMGLVKHADRGIHVARFRALGLTAYGKTQPEAINALKGLFNRFVHEHRRSGVLEKCLDHAGVEWCWADEYDGEYEDTNKAAVVPGNDQVKPDGAFLKVSAA